jgi:hypothetical protein
MIMIIIMKYADRMLWNIARPSKGRHHSQTGAANVSQDGVGL